MTRSGFAILLLLAIGVSGCISPEARRQRSLSAAEEAAVNGDLGRAVEVLQLALDYDPRDLVVATELARIYEEMGDVNRARRVVEKFPGKVEEPSWLNLRARALFRYGRYQEAVRISAALEQAAELESETVRTLSDMVVERKMKPEGTGDLPRAWIPALVHRLLDEHDPVTALSLDGADPRGGSGQAEASRTLFGARRAVARFRGGAASLAARGAGRHRRREYWSRGVCWCWQEGGRRSHELDTRFLADYSDHPKRAEILVAESRRRLARGDAEGALRLVDEALTLDGCDVQALVLKGLVLQWSGRTEEAEMALRAALAFDPNNQMARQALEHKTGRTGGRDHAARVSTTMSVALGNWLKARSPTRSWALLIGYILLVFASLPFVREVVIALRQQHLLGAAVTLLYFVAAVAVVYHVVFDVRLSDRIAFLALVLLAAATGAMILGLSIPEERIHFVQYGLLALSGPQRAGLALQALAAVRGGVSHRRFRRLVRRAHPGAAAGSGV